MHIIVILSFLSVNALHIHNEQLDHSGISNSEPLIDQITCFVDQKPVGMISHILLLTMVGLHHNILENVCIKLFKYNAWPH